MSTIKSFVKRVFRVYLPFIAARGKDLSGVGYWKKRARRYGVRSVLNIGHPEEGMEAVTKMQKEKIFPVLKRQLNGSERTVLDFGCGPGRFTPDLADIIDGRAIGVDPIKDLLDLAPIAENVEYMLMKEGVIPLETSSMDVVWICLVLGGILDDDVLQRTLNEIDRALKRGGLLFLVENTSEQSSAEHWKGRSVRDYQEMISFVRLDHLGDYYDLDERISMMAGRKS